MQLGRIVSICAYQEDNRYVQQESDDCVHQQSEVTDVRNVLECHARNLDEEGDQSVHNGAGWRKVVERYQGVHLELGGRE